MKSATTTGTKPARVTKRRAETRARLLDAAFQVIADKGFGHVRIEDVCTAAGYTRGAFYSQFTSLEELFFTLYDQHVTLIMEQVVTAIAGADDPNDAPAVVERIAATLVLDRDWLLIKIDFLLHAARHPSLAQRLIVQRAQMRAIIENWITASAIELPTAVGTVADAAYAMVAAYDGVSIQLLLENDQAAASTWLNQLIAVVLTREKAQGTIRSIDAEAERQLANRAGFRRAASSDAEADAKFNSHCDKLLKALSKAYQDPSTPWLTRSVLKKAISLKDRDDYAKPQYTGVSVKVNAPQSCTTEEANVTLPIRAGPTDDKRVVKILDRRGQPGGVGDGAVREAARRYEVREIVQRCNGVRRHQRGRVHHRIGWADRVGRVTEDTQDDIEQQSLESRGPVVGTGDASPEVIHGPGCRQELLLELVHVVHPVLLDQTVAATVGEKIDGKDVPHHLR